MGKTANKILLAGILPEPLHDQIQNAKSDLFNQLGIKGAKNMQPHLTLHMPFTLSDRNIMSFSTLLAQFTKRQRPITLKTAGIGNYAHKNIHLKIQASGQLIRLHKHMASTLKTNFGITNASYRSLPYDPHVTLAFRDIRSRHTAQVLELLMQHHFETHFSLEHISIFRRKQNEWEEYQRFSFSNH